jgi:hypothetical protein
MVKYHNGIERIHPIKQVVVHGTAGGANSAALIDRWILTPKFERAQAYKNGEGFNLNIDYDGTINQFSDPKKYWYYHSSSWRGLKNRQDEYDATTVGIEFMNKANWTHPLGPNGLPYTDEQYKAFLEYFILKLYPENPNIDSISGHGAIQQRFTGKHKVCPGPQFKWELIATELRANMFQCELGNELIYNIKKDSVI